MFIQTFSVLVMQCGASNSLIWLMQEVTAPRLKHLALEINDFGVEDRLDACYNSEHFQTADLFQSLMIDWASSGGVRQQAGNNIEVVLPAANMMVYLTKLTLQGDGVWLKEHTDAIKHLSSLQKLRFRDMIFKSAMLLQPFVALKRWDCKTCLANLAYIMQSCYHIILTTSAWPCID